jgi:hypothetical protein
VLGTPRNLPKLPEGYHLDLISDPDTPTLRRQDGTVVARFVAGGATREAVELEAFNDLASREPRRPLRSTPSRRRSSQNIA